MKERFVSSGGAIFEGKSLSSISVHDDFAVSKLFCLLATIKNVLKYVANFYKYTTETTKLYSISHEVAYDQLTVLSASDFERMIFI